MNVYPVVIAGGKGERFWPKSRRSYPKQFLRLFGRYSLISQTQRRISHLAPPSFHRYVIPEELAGLLFQEFKIHRSSVLIEPEGKNTFPAICLAAAHLPADGLMVVLPADHIIRHEEKFYAAVQFACGIAEKGFLVTFGIEPDRPETGYGYIEIGDKIEEKEEMIAYQGIRFTEKPDLATAEEYLASKRFLWNSGMFVWRVATFWQEVERHFPDFFLSLLEFKRFIGTKDEKVKLKKLYENSPSISVDYAIMEKAERIAVIKANFQWDDVGSWLALERHFGKDKNGNIKFGQTFLLDTKDSIIYSDDIPICGFSLSDIIIIKTKDLVFVCPKAKAGEIKKFLTFLAQDLKGRRFL